MIESSFTWKVGYIILGCIQNMTMGGIIYGWSSISSLLVSNPSDGGPGLSNEFVHTMFVVASFCSFLGPLFLGFILDSYGPRICSAISILFIISGCLLIGFSETGESVSLLVAISLIGNVFSSSCFILSVILNYFNVFIFKKGFGGPGVQSAIIHLSNLFPVWKASATAIITGSFQLSFFIFYIFDRLWSTQNWDYKNIFLTYMGLCTINIMASIFVWPDKPFSFDPPIVFESDDQLSSLNNASFHKKRRKVSKIHILTS
jgi:MFS family permease